MIASADAPFDGKAVPAIEQKSLICLLVCLLVLRLFSERYGERVCFAVESRFVDEGPVVNSWAGQGRAGQGRAGRYSTYTWELFLLMMGREWGVGWVVLFIGGCRRLGAVQAGG